MGTAVFVVLVLTLVARPVAVFLFMKLMKCSTNQCLLVSWSGLRGASSSVFAIMAVAAGVRKTFNDYQETADFKLVKMHIDEEHIWKNRPIRDVSMPTGALALMIKRKQQTIVTRGDTLILPGDDLILSVPPYHPGKNEILREMEIVKTDPWCNMHIKDLKVPRNELIAMIIRGEETIIPDGSTRILENDVVVVYQST